MLGAGRLSKDDTIDHGAGICFYAKVGDKVKRGDRLCSLCIGENSKLPDEVLYDVMDLVHEAYEYSDSAPEKSSVIIDVLS